MTITVVDAQKNTAEFNDATITTVSCNVDDIIVAIWGMNFYAASAITAPTTPAGITAWTLIDTADRGSNQAHIKAWWSKVTSSGTKAITFNCDVNDANDHLFVYVFRGVNTTTPIRTKTNTSGASSTSWVAAASGTSPSAPVAGDMLLCAWGDGGGTTGQTSLTFPGSMTGQSQRSNGDPTGASGAATEDFSIHGAAYELLGSSGATGTRTATCNSADQWAALTIVLAAAGGFTAALGVATETDSAQTVAKSKTKAAGVTTESDAAQALTRSKRKTGGVATETDTAQAFTHSKTRAVGVAGETDSARTITAGKVYPALGLASTEDTARPFGVVKTRAVGVVVEADTAVTLGRLRTYAVGVAGETDTAQAIGHRWARTLGVAVEVDTALGFSAPGILLPAEEVDTAEPLGRVKSLALGVAVESSSAVAVGKAKTRAVGVAVEVDTAVEIGGADGFLGRPGRLLAGVGARGLTARNVDGLTAAGGSSALTARGGYGA